MNEIATRECMLYYITLCKGLFRYILSNCSERPTKAAHAAAGLHYAAEQKRSSPDVKRALTMHLSGVRSSIQGL